MKRYDWNELSQRQQADVLRQWPPAVQEGVDCVGFDDDEHPVYVNSRLPLALWAAVNASWEAAN